MKAIVDIDVNSEKFKRYSELFDKYQEQLAKTPNVWKAVGKEQAAMATQFERMTAALMAQSELAREGKEEEVRRLKDLTITERLWSSISKNSRSLYQNVIGVGQGVLKWGGILTGIATGASIFGIDRLATSMSATRQTAMGFGISPAELQAFGVNFGRVVDPDATLSQMTTMESDVTQRRPWYALMNGRQMSGNVSKDALAFLNAARDFAIRNKSNGLLGTLATSYGLPFSVEQLTRMANTGNKEWGTLTAGYQRDVKGFGVTNNSALAWQNLSTQFHRSGTVMLDQLALALGKLAGPLQQLSAGLTHAAVTVLGSPAVRQGIQDLANWMKNFSGAIDTKAFTAKVVTFTADVGAFADGVHRMLAVLRAPAAVGTWYAHVSELFTQRDTVDSGPGKSADFWNPRVATKSAADMADWYQHTGVSPAMLREANLAGVAASPIAATVPKMPQVTLPPIRVDVMNATGGSAIVSINGLAGQ